MKFTASYIDAYTNSTTANVMFADPETDPDQPSVLSFSRAIEPGFEDSAYYFEINDQSYSKWMTKNIKPFLRIYGVSLRDFLNIKKPNKKSAEFTSALFLFNLRYFKYRSATEKAIPSAPSFE